MVINGANLESYNQVAILDPSTGISKPFQVTSATAAQIFSESISSLSLPMDKALDLILSSASAQQSFPITFTLQPNSVDSDNIVDGSIINDKIRFKSITLSKLLPDLGSNPAVGDYVRWNGIDFILDPAPPSGGGGGASGTVTSINTGPGLLSSSNPITTIGTISVDIGIAGAAAPTIKIPYFNDKNKIVMDSTGLAPDFSGLRFNDGSGYFDIFNENALKIENNSGTELLTLDYSGDLSVSGAITSAGSPVCTAASPCGAAPGSVVTSVTVSPPLISSGTTDINIGAQTGTSQGDLILLGAPGTYPGVGKVPPVDGSSLLGVITDVLPGPAISVSKLLGNATVEVLFGTGNAQRWQRNLDNLGTLNPNDNYVIIGNGTSFEVQGGDTLLTSIGAQKANANLDNLGNLPPDLGNLIVGGGSSWILQSIPNCPVSRVVLANGNSFSCSTITTGFSGGTIVSNSTAGVLIGAAVGGSGPTGELRFVANDNSRYVGFKAPAVIPVSTMWTLPSADGTPGQVLTTGTSGVLSWSSVGGPNDVSNVATSTDNAIARFDGTTGKLIQNSGVIISDTNSITGVASILSAGNIDAGQTSIGANTGLAGTWGCFSNNTFPNSSTSYSLCQDDTGTTLLNAPTGQTVQSRINNSAITTVNSTGLGIFMTPANALDVTGSIEATGQISSGATTITSNAVDWNSGNIISTNFNCGANITFSNLKIGGTYTLVDTDTGTTQCNFSTTTTGTDAATVTYRFRPANTTRIASTHSIYTLMRVGNTVYVSWGSGF